MVDCVSNCWDVELIQLARRVGRTAAEHGIRVTTLYTDPDSRAQHALSTPFAFNLGSVSAYLDGDRIIEIAKKEGCRGIHPGYGFVSRPCPSSPCCLGSTLSPFPGV